MRQDNFLGQLLIIGMHQPRTRWLRRCFKNKAFYIILVPMKKIKKNILSSRIETGRYPGRSYNMECVKQIVDPAKLACPLKMP